VTPQARLARDLIAVKRIDEAIKALVQGLAATPDDPELHCLLSQAHLRAGRGNDALAEANAAVRLAADDEWPHRLRSISLRQLGKKLEAVTAAREAVRLAPELGVAHQALAEALLANGTREAARAEAMEAVRLEPESAVAQDVLGRVLLAQRKFRDAEAVFRRAIQLEPNNAFAHNNLGVALQRLGRRVDAVNAFNAAATIDPQFETAKKNLFSQTQALVGGGVIIFAVFALARASVLITGRSSVVTALAGIVLIASVVYVLIRRRPVRKNRIPPTALAYYKSERKRELRRTAPITLIKLASFAVFFAVVALAFALDSLVPALFAVPAALAWFFGAPVVWKRIRKAEAA